MLSELIRLILKIEKNFLFIARKMSNIYPSALIPDYSEILSFGDFKPIFSFNEVGAENRRNFFNSADETIVQLTYNYLKSSDVSVFLNFYQNMKGGFESFSLPEEVFIHGSTYQGALIDLTTINQWRFHEPPTVITVFQNIFTVTIKLVSTVNTIFDPQDDIKGFIQANRLNFSVPVIAVLSSVNTEVVPPLFTMSIIQPPVGDTLVVGTVSLAIYGEIIPTIPSALPLPYNFTLKLPPVLSEEISGSSSSMSFSPPVIDYINWGLGSVIPPDLQCSFVTYVPNEPFFTSVNPVSLTGSLPTLTQSHSQPLLPYSLNLETNPPYTFQVYIVGGGGGGEKILFVNASTETSKATNHQNYRNSVVINPVSPPFISTSSLVYFSTTATDPPFFIRREFVREVITPTGVTQFVNQARGFIINAIPPVLGYYLGKDTSIINMVNSVSFYNLTPDFDNLEVTTPSLQSSVTLANTPYRETVEPEPFPVVKYLNYREARVNNPVEPPFSTPLL